MRGARVSGIAGPAVASGVRLKVAALSAVLAGCLALVFSSPAAALIHRGHEFTGSIGAGELSGPSDVAVNESTGDIYVLDAAHNRVMVYGKEHEFLQAWGAGVKTAGSKEYEVCNAPGPCLPGTAGFGKGQFDEPVAIAVDNAPKSPSKGDVYVVANQSAKKAVMDKFNESGTLLSRLFTSKEERERFEENRIVGVAVEPGTGMVWVDREAEEEELIVQRLGNGSENKEVGVPTELELENVHGPARWGLTLDGKGNAYITYEPGGHTLEEQEEEEETIKEDAKERKQKGEEPQTPQLPCEKHACLAVKLAIKPSRGIARSLGRRQPRRRPQHQGHLPRPGHRRRVPRPRDGRLGVDVAWSTQPVLRLRTAGHAAERRPGPRSRFGHQRSTGRRRRQGRDRRLRPLEAGASGNQPHQSPPGEGHR